MWEVHARDLRPGLELHGLSGIFVRLLWMVLTACRVLHDPVTSAVKDGLEVSLA